MTLRHEAAFHRACRERPSRTARLAFLPRLIHHEEADAVLVFELISDAVTLRSLLAARPDSDRAAAAARAFGRALATAHRAVRSAARRDDRRWDWLPRDVPSPIGGCELDAEALAGLTSAQFQLLRVVQNEPGFDRYLRRLYHRWCPVTAIHGDIRLENVLVGPNHPEEGAIPRVWITDWEMVRLGDPAWDLAGALQDLLVLWISSISLPEDGRADGLEDGAGIPMEGLRIAARAMWAGYREVWDRGRGATGLLRRAVAYCPARLVQSAFEFAGECDRLPGQSVLLLQAAANVLADPESARVELFGIAPEYGLT